MRQRSRRRRPAGDLRWYPVVVLAPAPVCDYVPGNRPTPAPAPSRVVGGGEITLDDFPAIMDVREVAWYLRLSPGGVRDLLARGVLPGFRVGTGKGWRVYKRELELFLRTRGGTRDEAER